MQFKTDYPVDFGKRDPNSDVDEQLYQRWSPRSYKKVTIPESILESIMDAARWAPSSNNEQPWLFLTSGSEKEFRVYLDLLLEKNQEWARNAGIIGFIFAKRFFTLNDQPNRFSFFDCGAAWLSLSLQARKFGLYTHGIGGIKREEVGKALNVPAEHYEVVCGFTLGAIDTPQSLPADLEAREFPSPRKPLSEIWKKGSLS